MSSIDMVIELFVPIIQWAMPGATAVFLIMFGLRMAWGIMKGGKIK